MEAKTLSRALEICSASGNCDVCPYSAEICLNGDLVKDAYALMRGDARLLKWDEIVTRDNIASGPVWIEERNEPKAVKAWVLYVWRDMAVFRICDCKISVKKDNADFSKQWRCWSSRPTKAQVFLEGWDG